MQWYSEQAGKIIIGVEVRSWLNLKAYSKMNIRSRFDEIVDIPRITIWCIGASYKCKYQPQTTQRTHYLNNFL